jgi:8-oxo-dGTP diphosphatase
MGLLIETDEMEKDVPHRAARLYKFDSKKYRQLTKKGFAFDV